MELDQLRKIKKLAIIAMFSDDDLMDTLVLKGGNLLDVVYQVASRASVDLDFSMPNEFAPRDWKSLADRVRRRFRETFQPNGYHVFDVKVTERPSHVTPDMAGFWGGYRIEFKLITSEEFMRLGRDEEKARKQAAEVGSGHRKVFKIDISKFEYCDAKRPWHLDNYRIYVYSPAMLLFEKLRAICQQMPEYAKVVSNPSQSPRARDFFDIHTILENFPVDANSTESQTLLRHIFAAKRVPLALLGRIPAYREFHRVDFVSVKDTVMPGVDLKDFNFYFDYVVAAVAPLEPLWVEQPPSF